MKMIPSDSAHLWDPFDPLIIQIGGPVLEIKINKGQIKHNAWMAMKTTSLGLKNVASRFRGL